MRTECAAIQDVLVISDGLDRDRSESLKGRLKRVVAMLTRLVMRADQLGEAIEPYHAEVDYDDEHEHRFAEHEL